MDYDALLQQVRALLAPYNPEEKRMFGSLAFMVAGKICVSVRAERLMCHLGEQDCQAALAQPGVTPMVHGGRTMKEYIFVDAAHLTPDTVEQWVGKALARSGVKPRR